MVFARALFNRMLISTSMVPSGIALEVTLTPPLPLPFTAVIADWCVPAGIDDVGAVDDELHARVSPTTATKPNRSILCI